MTGFAWVVLGLVFLDELAAMAAYGVWGWQVADPRLLWVVVLPLAAMTAWWLFASPKARYGERGRREVVKVLVFGLASLALWDAGHHGWALALLVFSVVVNAVALHPRISEVAAQT
ncbi:YrdB family protein [Nocardioides cynanchi]|uniref:YrdB family protein n=1 Tax=Nocardioides cynanchi TaxID=2558918 RepID=UPI00124698EE|nr:YrdB family protein [Nocardioides cynanchi]